MRFLFIFLILGIEAGASESVLKVTLKSFEEPNKIIEISPTLSNQEVDANHHRWKMPSKKFQALIQEWLDLPGSVDQIKNCPRNYIRFEYRSRNMKRNEFVCNDKATSTRRRYRDFAKQLL